jgi:hypothetical protein
MEPWAKQETLETRRSNAVRREFIKQMRGDESMRHGMPRIRSIGTHIAEPLEGFSCFFLIGMQRY